MWDDWRLMQDDRPPAPSRRCLGSGRSRNRPADVGPTPPRSNGRPPPDPGQIGRGPPSDTPWKVLVVSSSGGVLLDLLALQPWLQRHDPTWVAPRAPDTDVLLRDAVVRWQPELDSSSLARLPLDVVRAMMVLRADRTDCVISAGTGLAVSWFLAALVLGVPRVWVDTFNFVDRPGRVARWCGRMADVVLTQRVSADPSRRHSVAVGLLY